MASSRRSVHAPDAEARGRFERSDSRNRFGQAPPELPHVDAVRVDVGDGEAVALLHLRIVVDFENAWMTRHQSAARAREYRGPDGPRKNRVDRIGREIEIAASLHARRGAGVHV